MSYFLRFIVMFPSHLLSLSGYLPGSFPIRILHAFFVFLKWAIHPAHHNLLNFTTLATLDWFINHYITNVNFDVFVAVKIQILLDCDAVQCWSSIPTFQSSKLPLSSPRRWRQHGPVEHQYPTTRLHCVTTQNLMWICHRVLHYILS